MKHLVSTSLGVMIALSFATQAEAQNYTATKVFDADSTVTTGTMGLGYCISNCVTLSTSYTPIGLSDSDVAYASQRVQSSYSYAGALVVWDNGLKPSSSYALYPGQSIPGYVAASNAGAVPEFPSGNFVPPINGATSFLTGVSNSGRLLAGGYDPTVPSGFTSPNKVLVPSVSGANDLYVSAVGGNAWSKVTHDASLTNLVGEDVSNDGRVVGYTVDAAGHSQAFFTTGNGGTLQLLNAPGASDSAFASINDRGVAAGVMVSTVDNSWHVFTYDTQSGALADLGLDLADFGGPALKINDAGQVVQGSRVYDPISHTWLQPTIAGLPDRLTFADINNSGDILAKSASGIYILQAVPEPATLLMTGLGLLGIGFVSRKKQRQMAHAC